MLSLEVKYDIKWPRELIEKRTQYMIDTTGNEIVRGIKENIMKRMSIYGGALAPLMPNTIRKKRGMRNPNLPLYALGMLYRSIHYYTGHRENRGSVGIMDVGRPSRRMLAYIHQFGLYKGGVARPFFGISKETQIKLNSMWRRWFAEKMSAEDLALLKSAKENW